MNEHANYKDGYIVFEDGGTSPIAYGACEKWFSTYDEAINYAIDIVKKSEKEITNVDILRRLSQLEKYIYDKDE